MAAVAKTHLARTPRAESHAVGYYNGARADPPGGKKPGMTRAKGASKMPLPPRPPQVPNEAPRRQRERFVCRRPAGDFWEYESALASMRPNYEPEDAIGGFGGEHVVAGK